MAEVIERRVVQQFPLYYDLYVPEGGKPKPLIIALHGYGGDKSSMMRLMRRVLRDGEDGAGDYVVACPQGPHQHLVMPTEESLNLGYGFGWLSNFKPEESVAMHHQLIREIIETLTSTGVADVLYVAAERDQYYTPDRMRRNAEALRRRARSVELRFFDAAHEVPRESYPVIEEWLLKQL